MRGLQILVFQNLRKEDLEIVAPDPEMSSG